MKKISLVVLLSFLSNVALADCDWSKIQKNTDNTYTYTSELNICVGNLVKDSKAKDVQIDSLKKAIDLKDLALTKSNERVNLWMDTSYKLQDHLAAIDSINSKNQWIYFGLGILVTGAAVWGAGHLANR